jgi:two-component system cell cycle sensor histidine kinase/response regulator CckA
MVIHSLRFLGYNVLEAGNGEQGLAISRQSRDQIDMIFTDIVMPRISGPAMVSSLREEKINFPVLYTTGFSDRPGITDEDNLIIKPYTTKLLAAKIREILEYTKA